VIGFLGDKSADRYQPIAASIAIDQLFSAVGLAIISQIGRTTMQIPTCVNILGKPAEGHSRRFVAAVNSQSAISFYLSACGKIGK